ncbi:hypothetical protein CAPTEDRAFT_204753 [Capitella teleta]|uniref:Uncharacterized protein n=1 Tax=Capitella teleta TaxID=283909 RepID=R7V764_CAPTE|nr:hypothetical protein CAPTEDRAFT_204753 [Capitella teleta]|eukprot:ELU12206.1 hypothetical protein CAPTEDRAFT_204753 [Capitella teleta]
MTFVDNTIRHSMRLRVMNSDTTAGCAARAAEQYKLAKYCNLSANYQIQPLTFETLESRGPPTTTFNNELKKEIKLATEGKREGHYLDNYLLKIDTATSKCADQTNRVNKLLVLIDISTPQFGEEFMIIWYSYLLSRVDVSYVAPQANPNDSKPHIKCPDSSLFFFSRSQCLTPIGGYRPEKLYFSSVLDFLSLNFDCTCAFNAHHLLTPLFLYESQDDFTDIDGCDVWYKATLPNYFLKLERCCSVRFNPHHYLDVFVEVLQQPNKMFWDPQLD